MKISLVPALAAAAWISLLPPKILADSFDIVELAPPAGAWAAEAFAINNHGQAAGAAYGHNYDFHAVLWTDGVAKDVNDSSGYASSMAFGLNDNGQFAGDCDPIGDWWAPFFSAGGAFQRISSGVPGARPDEAYGLNNLGQVIGTGGPTGAYVWQSGIFTPLAPLPGEYPRPQAINDAGVIVGSCQGDAGRHPVRWVGGAPESLPGLSSGEALAINKFGQIAGYQNTAAGRKAFVWDPTNGITWLPGPGDFTWGINTNGDVVGSTPSGPVLWRHSASGYEAILLNTVMPAGSGWQISDAYAINDAGQIAGGASHNGLSCGYILMPNPAPTLETAFANRDNPFATWADTWAAAPNPNPIYAGVGSGDLVGWRVKNAIAGATIKWTATQISGLAHRVINGPEGIDNNEWRLADKQFNWPPGTYNISCLIRTSGKPDVTISTAQVVGRRSPEYVVVGQVKPIADYRLTNAAQAELVHALVESYNIPKTSFLGREARQYLLGKSADDNAKLWMIVHGAEYILFNKGGPPDQVSLPGVPDSSKFYMVQTTLNSFPDTVELPTIISDDTVSNLLYQESYRMFAHTQFKYLLNAEGKVADVRAIKYTLEGGQTKFIRIPVVYHIIDTMTIRGVEIDFVGNSSQALISAEVSPDSGKLPVPVASSGTALSGYIAARIGLEGRAPNYALFGRDAPWIYTEVVTRLDSEGADTDSVIRLSVDTTWSPKGVTGTSHFNEIRIYERVYGDPFLQFKQVDNGYFAIDHQLASFIQSGSTTWPSPPPPASITTQ